MRGDSAGLAIGGHHDSVTVTFPSFLRVISNVRSVIIADNLRKARWSLGWVSAIDCEGQTIWIVDAHRGDGRRFVAHADELLTAFVELEREVLTVTFYLESIKPET